MPWRSVLEIRGQINWQGVFLSYLTEDVPGQLISISSGCLSEVENGVKSAIFILKETLHLLRERVLASFSRSLSFSAAYLLPPFPGAKSACKDWTENAYKKSPRREVPTLKTKSNHQEMLAFLSAILALFPIAYGYKLAFSAPSRV